MKYITAVKKSLLHCSIS